MTHLIKIGNSQGIRIPKPLVEQAQLDGKELKLQLVNEGLLISCKKEIREHWKDETEQIIAAQGVEAIDVEWLDLPLVTDDELEW
jgi:antitoxin MazE